MFIIRESNTTSPRVVLDQKPNQKSFKSSGALCD
jgi:hypothetical protein